MENPDDLYPYRRHNYNHVNLPPQQIPSEMSSPMPRTPKDNLMFDPEAEEKRMRKLRYGYGGMSRRGGRRKSRNKSRRNRRRSRR
jgi:hypothetical protein